MSSDACDRQDRSEPLLDSKAHDFFGTELGHQQIKAIDS